MMSYKEVLKSAPKPPYRAYSEQRVARPEGSQLFAANSADPGVVGTTPGRPTRSFSGPPFDSPNWHAICARRG
jgi:hypothetical protein